MKKNTLLVGLLVLLTLTLTVFSEQVNADTSIYRLYNRRNGEHLYTVDVNEAYVLYYQHGWGFEGTGWIAPDEGNGTPVYRLYNAKLQNHLYTTDTNEVRILTTRHGWTKDNGGKPVFYSNGGVNIYRVYNPKLRGLHHWTTDLNEYTVLPRHGWRQEGVKFKALALGQQVRTQYHNSNSQIVSGYIGNSEMALLLEEDAIAYAEEELQDPNSEFYSYTGYNVIVVKTTSNETLYSVEFTK